MKRVLAREILNPLSRLVLDGSIAETDVVRVRTLCEAEIMMKESPKTYHGWINLDGESKDKNAIVILKNHPVTDTAE